MSQNPDAPRGRLRLQQAFDRRAFLKTLAAGSAGVMIAPPLRAAAASLPKARVTKVNIYRPANLNQTMNQSNYVVTVETDQPGLIGIGDGGTPDTLTQCAQLLIGRNPFDIERCWQAMYRSWFYSPGKEKIHALGALDTALWDIKGKALGVPVYDLFGGMNRDYLECYLGGGGQGAGLSQNARMAMEAGYRGFRVQAPGTGGGRAGGAGGGRAGGGGRGNAPAPAADPAGRGGGAGAAAAPARGAGAPAAGGAAPAAQPAAAPVAATPAAPARGAAPAAAPGRGAGAAAAAGAAATGRGAAGQPAVGAQTVTAPAGTLGPPVIPPLPVERTLPQGGTIFTQNESIRRLDAMGKALRDGVGPNGDWLIDFHQEYDLVHAMEGCKILEQYEPYLIEDPTREEMFREDIPKLRKLTTAPLAAGEQWGQRWDFHKLVENHDIDYVRCTLPNVGGITEMMKIAALCETHAVGIVPHFTGPIAVAAIVHALGPFSGPVLVEIGNNTNMQTHISEGRDLRTGKLWPNGRPGIGIALNMAQLTLVASIDARGAGGYTTYYRPDGSQTSW